MTDLDALLSDLLVIEDDLKTLTSQRDSIRAQMADAVRDLPDHRWVGSGGQGVMLTNPIYRFNPTKALGALAGTGLLDTISVRMPDAKLAKAALETNVELYQKCCDVSAPSLRRITEA